MSHSRTLFNLPIHSLVQLTFHWLETARQWLDAVEVHNRKLAHFLCHVIPSQCPFERDIKFLGRQVAHIPPLCKLNPFYEQLVGLRFRALCYLVEQCGETI